MAVMQNPAVAHTYLTVSFKDKDTAKALGARWDGGQRQWYVPEGRELTPFAQWLPAGAGSDSAFASMALSTAPLQDGATSRSTSLALASKKGVSLSSLLAGVWTLVEVVELRANGGHVFMGVSERDTSGAMLANTILPEFERATGAQLAPGIKLLVRARPVFKSLHGFSIEIDAIDPEYTLGDLEAKKREIRERLQSEGVFTANKQVPPPWDLNAVLVVAPDWGTFSRRPIVWNSSGSAASPMSTAGFRAKALPRRSAMHSKQPFAHASTPRLGHRTPWSSSATVVPSAVVQHDIERPHNVVNFQI